MQAPAIPTGVSAHLPALAPGVCSRPLQEALPAEVTSILRRLCCENSSARDQGPDFEIGICDRSLNLVRRVSLNGHQRVWRLQQELQDLRYQTISIGTTKQLRGCDLLLVPAASA